MLLASGPGGANAGSRWEGSTAGGAAPTGTSGEESPRPAAARSPIANDPVGALGFTKLPTGYLHARLRREGLARLISPKTTRNHPTHGEVRGWVPMIDFPGSAALCHAATLLPMEEVDDLELCSGRTLRQASQTLNHVTD